MINNKEVVILEQYSEEQPVYFDVDDTLVFLQRSIHPSTVVDIIPHDRHIQSIKNHWLRGHHVVVWSKGGKKWADYVVDFLGLRQFVHEVKTKGKWYYDDRPLSELGDRIYYDIPQSKEALAAYQSGLKESPDAGKD